MMTETETSETETRDERVHRILHDIGDAAAWIDTTTTGRPYHRPPWHNEEKQGEILIAWEELAYLTGHAGLAHEKGFEDIGKYVQWEGKPDDAVRDALSRMLEAAEGIQTTPDEGETREEFAAANEARQEATLESWDSIKRSTGLGDNDPIVPIGEIKNVLEAMGVAMFHIGSATLDYMLVTEWPNGDRVKERFRSGERSARIAHRVLHHISESGIAGEHPLNLGPEFRKYSRMAKIWLTRERAKAARALGRNDIPGETDDLHAAELDGRWTGPEEDAKEDAK